MRLSNWVAKIEDRVVAAYAVTKPAVSARLTKAHDTLIIHVEAAKHAHTFYKQVVADVQAKR